MPCRTPVPGSVWIFQPTLSCFRLAVSARMPRSCGLSTPVCLPPRDFWNSLIALTMRSLTSPVMAPLYCPTQARSDCSVSRSACPIALAVSSGFCSAGRIHIVVREVGGPGQTALKEASVLVIGAGGLGAPVLMYLAAAGVGTLGAVDDDIVSLSNLQRQVIHTTPDIGRRKVDSAAEVIHALNPHVHFEAHAVRLDAKNVMSLISGYDLVLDGSDNFETRYLVSDACFFAGKPLVTAALGMFDGALATIRAHERNEQGEFNPTYRCLFPEPPPPGTVPACAEAGVMGALAGMLGSMMALEAIREIVGFGESLVGRLVMVDARAMRFETLRYARDPANPLNGDKPTITDLSGYAA